MGAWFLSGWAERASAHSIQDFRQGYTDSFPQKLGCGTSCQGLGILFNEGYVLVRQSVVPYTLHSHSTRPVSRRLASANYLVAD